MVEDAAFEGRERRVAAMARPGRVDGEIEGDAALLHDQDAVGERHRFRDVVGDEHGGEALRPPHPFDQRLHVDAGQRVERAEGLVEGEEAAAG